MVREAQAAACLERAEGARGQDSLVGKVVAEDLGLDSEVVPAALEGVQEVEMEAGEAEASMAREMPMAAAPNQWQRLLKQCLLQGGAHSQCQTSKRTFAPPISPPYRHYQSRGSYTSPSTPWHAPVLLKRTCRKDKDTGEAVLVSRECRLLPVWRYLCTVACLDCVWMALDEKGTHGRGSCTVVY